MENKDFYNHVRNPNPLVRFLVSGYFNELENILKPIEVSTALDVGSGRGEVTNYIGKLNGSNPIGLDNRIERVRFLQNEYPNLPILNSDGRKLPFNDNLFDLVIATEVLEHQERPEEMMQEIYRVSKKYGFFSVPNEPYWRLGNFIRGQYVRNLGNSPDHIQHWSKKSFEKFLLEFFPNVEVNSVYVWNLALCKK